MLEQGSEGPFGTEIESGNGIAFLPIESHRVPKHCPPAHFEVSRLSMSRSPVFAQRITISYRPRRGAGPCDVTMMHERVNTPADGRSRGRIKRTKTNLHGHARASWRQIGARFHMLQSTSCGSQKQRRKGERASITSRRPRKLCCCCCCRCYRSCYLLPPSDCRGCHPLCSRTLAEAVQDGLSSAGPAPPVGAETHNRQPLLDSALC